MMTVKAFGNISITMFMLRVSWFLKSVK